MGGRNLRCLKRGGSPSAQPGKSRPRRTCARATGSPTCPRRPPARGAGHAPRQPRRAARPSASRASTLPGWEAPAARLLAGPRPSPSRGSQPRPRPLQLPLTAPRTVTFNALSPSPLRSRPAPAPPRPRRRGPRSPRSPRAALTSTARPPRQVRGRPEPDRARAPSGLVKGTASARPRPARGPSAVRPRPSARGTHPKVTGRRRWNGSEPRRRRARRRPPPPAL